MPGVRQTTNGVVITSGGVASTLAVAQSEANQKLSHRWILDDVNGTVEDSAGTADGENFGVSSLSGDWVGGAAGEGDGVDDYIDTNSTLDGYRSGLDTGGAIAFSFDMPSSTDEEMVFGTDDHRVGVNPATSGQTGEVGVYDQKSTYWAVFTDSTYDDGNPHRAVINFVDNDVSNIEVWIDQQEQAVSTDTGGSTDVSDTDLSVDAFLFAYNGTQTGNFGGVVDDICIFNDSLTQTEIESYQNPWV